MEDAIAKDPEKYLEEKGLKLIKRQHVIGSYRFDLLFEDRHNGKLIVEIQKGTLDRNHTYRILDYYDEYKEKNPQDFIDVMIVANTIPSERKKRLNSLSISYREIPESMFINLPDESSESKTEVNIMNNSEKKRGILPDSSFIIKVREKLEELNNNNIWKIGGKTKSLTAKHQEVNKVFKNRIKENWYVQIWLERPKKGIVRCKFEVAGDTPKETEKERLREKIAESIRQYLIKKGLPEGIEEATRSTIIASPIDLPKIQEIKDDVDENIDIAGIEKIVKFSKLLERTFDKEFLKTLEKILTNLVNKEKE